jgi:hypothetical protein
MEAPPVRGAGTRPRPAQTPGVLSSTSSVVVYVPCACPPVVHKENPSFPPLLPPGPMGQGASDRRNYRPNLWPERSVTRICHTHLPHPFATHVSESSSQSATWRQLAHLLHPDVACRVAPASAKGDMSPPPDAQSGCRLPVRLWPPRFAQGAALGSSPPWPSTLHRWSTYRRST